MIRILNTLSSARFEGHSGIARIKERAWRNSESGFVLFPVIYFLMWKPSCWGNKIPHPFSHVLLTFFGESFNLIVEHDTWTMFLPFLCHSIWHILKRLQESEHGISSHNKGEGYFLETSMAYYSSSHMGHAYHCPLCHNMRILGTATLNFIKPHLLKRESFLSLFSHRLLELCSYVFHDTFLSTSWNNTYFVKLSRECFLSKNSQSLWIVTVILLLLW